MLCLLLVLLHHYISLANVLYNVFFLFSSSPLFLHYFARKMKNSSVATCSSYLSSAPTSYTIFYPSWSSSSSVFILFLPQHPVRGQAVTLLASRSRLRVPVQPCAGTRSASLSSSLSIAFHSPLKDRNPNPYSRPHLPSSPFLAFLFLSTSPFCGSLYLFLSSKTHHTLTHTLVSRLQWPADPWINYKEVGITFRKTIYSPIVFLKKPCECDYVCLCVCAWVCLQVARKALWAGLQCFVN